ncbi:MAG: hydrogenase iron-sulfur subunit, partial [bacterium]
MMDVGRHPKIKMMTNAEVEHISGFIGNFKVRVRRKARFVNENECTACGDCARVCPVVVPDNYQCDFSSRKAIYIPFPQAVPSSFILDLKNCLGHWPIACGKCQDACEKNCIDYDDFDRIEEYEVGAVIVATGMDIFDPMELEEYGYGKYENVISSMEFERLICAGGPTEGHFIRPTDSTRPRKIGFIQCVGSRSRKRGNPYCSNICCMNTIKDTLLLADHYPDTESSVFYMDIRAFGKGFEDLYMRSKQAGTKYIRGIPGEIIENPETKNLSVVVENTISGEIERHELDMVVLSVGVIPRLDSDVVQQLLTLSRTADGFFLEAHPKLKPVDAPTKGVFFAGCAESPKDVKDSVTQAGAAAARASILLNQGIVKIEAITAHIMKDVCTMCGICSQVCPYNSIEASDKKMNIYPNVIEASCSGCGTCGAECPFDAIIMRHFKDEQIIAQVDAILAQDHINKIVCFACNWCSYAGGDGAGTARLQYPTSNRLIRTMCSGRVDEKFVIHAFKKGAPIVLVSGCHFADCHYINAVHWTQKRVEKLWNKMERLGIRPERLQLEWISAAEGQKFAKVMRELEELRKQVTPEEVVETMRIFEEEERKATE